MMPRSHWVTVLLKEVSGIKRSIIFSCWGVLLFFGLSIQSFGWQGDMGYEGGISTGQIPNKKLLDYKEVVYVSGKPLEMTGTVGLKKSVKKDSASNGEILTTVYTYSLKDTSGKATLTRNISYATQNSGTDNGQTIQSAQLTGKTTEVIKIDGATYTLQNMEFTQSDLVDKRPAMEYFSGDFKWKKRYNVSGTATTGGAITGNVEVDTVGTFTGFNGYWSSTETIQYNMAVSSETKVGDLRDKWGGSVRITTTFGKNYTYREYENAASSISFSGGMIEELKRKSVLRAKGRMPIFDNTGISTYATEEKENTLTIEAFPETKLMKVADTAKITGHWAKKDIDALMSLDILKIPSNDLNPEKLITRGEFVDQLVKVVAEVPKDPVYVSKKATGTGRAKTAKPIFSDVNDSYPYRVNLEQAYNRGIVSGRGTGIFSPDEYVSFADAITMIIKCMGLEQVAKWNGNVLNFKDNDSIPAYARNAIFAAARIGLIKGDPEGYVKPMEKLSVARVAVILNRVKSLMNDTLVKEYTEELLKFSY